MHDLLEGALPLEVKELLKHFISTKIISLGELCEVMKSFPYAGPDACNKPTPIFIDSTTINSKDHALKQTGECCITDMETACEISMWFNRQLFSIATQMWCFARLLPLMIGNKVE